ncbi:hypothetical protein [Corynebacterium nuruki]|jgi:hypothetical protein|uniref:Uncharacterized protein n=1 Tax=Corynebacterium nuruki TaxID=1032851 RepID=A0A3D4T196_9CORY|nr:hypothetical protein [Corynebacterium nuruki]HCT15085.1 hypothetical protein [Corynebacterium nuruki]
MDVEPHWGDPERSQVREDTSRGERIAGITWLSVGAVVSLLIAALYLGSRISIGDTSVPVPWPVLAAPLFNWVLTRTALLWTGDRRIAAIPLWVWLAGYLILVFWPALPGLGGDTILGSSLWTLLLLPAGLAGGGWALLRLK